MLRGAVFGTALSLVVPVFAFAQEGPTLGGHVKGLWFQQVTDPWDIDRAGARLQLSLSGGVADPVEYYGAIDFELDSRLLTGDQPARRGEGFDIYPVELYLNLSVGPVELRVGQQFIFWGRTDWSNPTDVITSWDYANMASEIEDYRRAPVAVRLNWYIVGELMLDLVWAPIFMPDRFPATIPAELGGLPVVEKAALVPDHNPANSEYGLRLSQSVSSWAFDWALAFYKGFEKIPVYVVEPVMGEPPAPGAPPVPVALSWQRQYHPLWVFGGDFAKALGSFVVKGEVAFKLGEDEKGDDPLVRNSRLEGVLGVRYTFSQELEFGVQYISRFYVDYSRKGEREALTALTGNRPVFVDKEWTHEVSLLVRWDFLDEFGSQLLGIYSPSYNDFFVLGFLFWDIADGLKAYVGAVAFGGEKKITPYGRQVDFSRAFVELKYSF